jgi:hypothetical protein
MGVVLLLSIIVVEAMAFICAQHDWRVATGVLTTFSFVLLMAALLFGMTAKIGMVGRALWIALILGYIVFMGVEFYKFCCSPNTSD